LSWIGAVRGHRVSGLGLDRFGQTGDLPDLYSAYRLDSDAMIDAMAGLFLD
jgi:pyruvate dehydrogenase E1 component